MVSLPSHFRRSLVGLSAANIVLSLPVVVAFVYLAICADDSFRVESPDAAVAVAAAVAGEEETTTPESSTLKAATPTSIKGPGENALYSVVVAGGLVFVSSVFGVITLARSRFGDHCLLTAYLATAALAALYAPLAVYLACATIDKERDAVQSWKRYLWAGGLFTLLSCEVNLLIIIGFLCRTLCARSEFDSFLDDKASSEHEPDVQPVMALPRIHSARVAKPGYDLCGKPPSVVSQYSSFRRGPY